MTKTPDIWMLHTTNPREGESQWGGCYIVEADAHNDAATMRKVTGLDWEVVPMVRADSLGKCLHQIAEPAAYPHLPHSIADVVDFMDGRGVNVDFSHPAPAGGTSLYTAAQMRAYVDADRAQRAEPPQAADHPDDAAVDALAALMKAKLAKQRAKGYGGWNDKALCSQQRLSDMLRTHVDKGDPVDVANFCAFLVARGEGIAAAPQAMQAAVPEVLGWVHKTNNGKLGSKFYTYEPHCDHAVRDDGGEKIAVVAAPAHPAGGVPAAKNGRQVLVDSGALQMVLNALERDALEGKQVRAAMRLELMQSIATHPTQQGLDAEYQRGYQDGYNRRDAEVKGALV